MLNKKQFEELINSLKNIEDRLDTLINIQRATMPKPKIGKEERKVMKLCDRKHTIEDIMIKTGKTRNNVNVMLSRLRDKGLIRSVAIKGRLVYERI
jgi:biotin operon repressor